VSKRPDCCHYCGAEVVWREEYTRDERGRRQVRDRVPVGAFMKGSLNGVDFNVYLCGREDCRERFVAWLKRIRDGEVVAV